MFSGVWGVASIAGPLVGGYITDALSWRWVFYLNLPLGALAATVIAIAYPPGSRTSAAKVDWLGAALLFGGVTCLLVAVGGATSVVVPWLAATAALLAALVAVERRASHPILPLDSFGQRVVSYSLVVVFMTGMAMFGAIAFVPLFVQGVLGGTATQAGQVLTPLFLGWVLTSVVSARLTVRIGYRPVTFAGVALLSASFVVLAMLDTEVTLFTLFGAVFALGCGHGLVDAVAAARRPARCGPSAPGRRDLAQPVLSQRRRRRRRGGDGRDARAQPDRVRHAGRGRGDVGRCTSPRGRGQGPVRGMH